jgi:glycosyltransferase involved in cell wall biosynthesis
VKQPHLSICMATHNKPGPLARTLASIARQYVPFAYEIIVVDDGSDGDEVQRVCEAARVCYQRIDRPAGYRNPGPARNVAYRLARGEVLLLQSDDVVHETADSITRLAEFRDDRTFNIATVYNTIFTPDGEPAEHERQYTGVDNPRPLFFLGSVRREHLYAVGGNDEDFTEPGYEDDWLGDCLIHGLGLTPHYRDDIIGLHQHHRRPPLGRTYRRMGAIYRDKVAAASGGYGSWMASGGAWQ